jgi:hypothetical protein
MCQLGTLPGKCCNHKGLNPVQRTAKGGAGPLRHPLSPAFFHLANV